MSTASSQMVYGETICHEADEADHADHADHAVVAPPRS